MHSAGCACFRPTTNLNPRSLQIWDTPSSKQDRSVFDHTFRKRPDAVLLVCDLTKSDSFETLDFWLTTTRFHSSNPTPLLFIAGNKCDDADGRIVDSKVATERCEKLGIPYCEISARNSTGIDDLFANMARAVLIAQGAKPAELFDPKSN